MDEDLHPVDELKKMLRYSGLYNPVQRVDHDDRNTLVQFWLRNTYVFREPEKTAEPVIDPLPANRGEPREAIVARASSRTDHWVRRAGSP